MKVWMIQDYRNLAKMMLAGIIAKREAQKMLDVAHPASSGSRMGFYEELLKAGQEAKKGSL